MRYQRLSEDSSVIVTETGESQVVSSALHSDRNVRQTQKLLLIFLVIQWVRSQNKIPSFICKEIFRFHR